MGWCVYFYNRHKKIFDLKLIFLSGFCLKNVLLTIILRRFFLNRAHGMGTIHYFETLDSTNSYAVRHFDELSDGDLVVAKAQTAGRGRLNRKWISKEGNLFASFVIKEPFEEPFYATMVSSLSVVAAVKELYPQVNPVIKWPNDVIIGEKKLCGILCEGVIREGKLNGIICGIGVNLNLTEEELAAIDQPAISLSVAAAEKINLKKFTDQLAIYLNWYYITGNSHASELYRVWKDRNAIIGKIVNLLPPSGEVFSAKILDIGEDGRLIAERENGEILYFSCGDVKMKPSNK